MENGYTFKIDRIVIHNSSISKLKESELSCLLVQYKPFLLFTLTLAKIDANNTYPAG